jgi:hypothetical protein
MAITYKGIPIVRKGDGLHYRIGWMQRGPFEHYQAAQDDIDEHMIDHDDENIYGLASVRQSIEEDRK